MTTKPAGKGEKAERRGRPSTFTPAIGERICAELAKGRSLRAICEEDDMPAESTVRAWALHDVYGFHAQYTRARELQAHTLAEEIIEISNSPHAGVVRTVKPDGSVEEKHADMIEHRRLQVDARKWYLSKVLPKVYGDKLELGGGLNLTNTPATLTDAELQAIATRASKPKP